MTKISKKEYELIYDGKERKENILAETMRMPFQEVKTFRNGVKAKDWTNKLIFRDNLLGIEYDEKNQEKLL